MNKRFRTPVKIFKEDLKFQCQFFEALEKRLPDDLTILQRLGELYASSGRVLESIRVDLRACDLAPNDPFVHYNLACNFALAGRLDFALEHLSLSLKLGFRDVPWIAKDPDLVPLRNLPEFISLLQQFRT